MTFLSHSQSLLVACVIYLTFCVIFVAEKVLVNGACVYTSNGNTLNLTGIANTELDYEDDSTGTKFAFAYTPCRNGLTCNSDDGISVGEDYMATQTGSNCFYLAEYDESVKPSYSSSTWTFTYANGQGGRVFVAEYKCGGDKASVKSVDETTSDDDISTYTMTIEYSGACSGGSGGGGGGGSSSSDDDLSLGSIILIVLAGIIFLYCVIGYVICAKKNPENGWGNVKANTPHLDFWCLVPKLTWAGCCVTKDWILGMVNKIRGKDGDDSYDSVDDA